MRSRKTAMRSRSTSRSQGTDGADGDLRRQRAGSPGNGHVSRRSDRDTRAGERDRGRCRREHQPAGLRRPHGHPCRRAVALHRRRTRHGAASARCAGRHGTRRRGDAAGCGRHLRPRARRADGLQDLQLGPVGARRVRAGLPLAHRGRRSAPRRARCPPRRHRLPLDRRRGRAPRPPRGGHRRGRGTGSPRRRSGRVPARLRTAQARRLGRRAGTRLPPQTVRSTTVARDTISILDGSTFLVSDLRGDIDASPDQPHGFFFRDTRFLSRWKLTANGSPLNVLSTDENQYFTAQFFLVPPTGTVNDNPTVSIIRKRSIGDGFHEDVTVINHGGEPIEVELRLEAGADFADLFEVKDALAKKGKTSAGVEKDTLVLAYDRDDFRRETRIRASKTAGVDERGLTFRLRIDAHDEWNTCVFVQPVTESAKSIKYRHDDEEAKPNIGMSLDDFLAAAPQLETDWDPLEHIYERSLIDLAALRFETTLFPGQPMPAAGLPWFMTVFGRDSLLTSFQALPFTAELAETTLRVLARYQAAELDDFRDAEPGKILHEIRFGELTHFDERPHSPYYGTADATPLFLVLLDEYERWTGDTELVRELEPNARAALQWIDEHGDRDGDGYVEYERRNKETGLENQCWKDSWDSIRFADGTIAKGPPIATCEIQGYVYDAKVRVARLAREIWNDDELADRLEREAEQLRQRFNEDFWLEGRGYYALALDGEKRPVDSITSNAGHLL